MDIIKEWEVSFDDVMVEANIGRQRGMYAFEVKGDDDFIIATEGDWFDGYSRVGRRIVFTVRENVYIQGRVGYFYITSKRNADKGLTLAISQDAMVYGFDFEYMIPDDNMSDAEKTSKHTSYLGGDSGECFVSKVDLDPTPPTGRGVARDVVNVPFEVYGGTRGCYVVSISQYYGTDESNIRRVVANGIKASVYPTDRLGRFNLEVRNFGKSCLSKFVYNVVRLAHADDSRVFSEVKFVYGKDKEMDLSVVGDKSITVDGNGVSRNLQVDGVSLESGMWHTASDCDWIETTDGTDGFVVTINQFVSEEEGKRTGNVLLYDKRGVLCDMVTVEQSAIVDKEDHGGGEEEPEIPEIEVAWIDESAENLTPNPPNSHVMLQLSASWCIVSYDTVGHGIRLSQDSKDAEYPFERKCRLLAKNANNLEKVLAFDIIQNGTNLSCVKR